jgi:type I restriction enzyme, S subunit
VQISIINYSELHPRLLRLDSEYYSEKNLKDEQLVKSNDYKLLSEFCYVTDGEHGTVETTEEGYAQYYGARNVLWGMLDNKSVEYITQEVHFKNKRSILQPSDILISCVGANVGHAALVPKDIGIANIVRNVALLRSTSDIIENKYLLAYFLSKYGKALFIRGSTGNAQPLVSLDNIKEIPVPFFPNEFQSYIAKIVEKSEFSLKDASDVYNIAISVLLEALGLNNWQPTHQLTYTKNFSDTQKADRFDAEYFQPMYDEILEKVLTYKNGVISIFPEAAELQDKNFTPKENYEYKYIELSNISDNGDVTGYTQEIGINLPSRARRVVKTGDVIVSSVEGSLNSIALIDKNADGALCSTGFYVIRSKKINAETLLVFLKSVAGQLQLKKGCTGTILTAISREEFSRLVVPNFELDVQTEIKHLIQEMYHARETSKALLEIAKCGVEIAIEQDEAAAEHWIKAELEKINVNFD